VFSRILDRRVRPDARNTGDRVRCTRSSWIDYLSCAPSMCGAVAHILPEMALSCLFGPTVRGGLETQPAATEKTSHLGPATPVPAN